MINESLKYVASDLDAYLKRKYDSSESRVKLGSILNQDGSVPEDNRNKIILSLISLEHESAVQTTLNGSHSGGRFNQVNPPVKFNLNIIFSALFNQYEEGLKFLSDTIFFFQAKSVFNPQNSPGLNASISQMTLEVIKLNYSETYNLWASIGAKYIPSIPLKMRLLTFQSNDLFEAIPEISNPVSEAVPQ